MCADVQRLQAASITVITSVSRRGQCQRRRQEYVGLLQPAESTHLSARWHWDSQKWERTAEGSEGLTEPAKRERRGCCLHSSSDKVEFRAGCLEKTLPAQGNSHVAAAPPPSSASPAPGAQPQSCRLSLWARVQAFPLPTHHLLPQDKGSLPLASIDPMLPTLMENMVILRKRVWMPIDVDVKMFSSALLPRLLNSLALVFLHQRRYRIPPLEPETSIKANKSFHPDSLWLCFRSLWIRVDRLYYCLVLAKLS